MTQTLLVVRRRACGCIVVVANDEPRARRLLAVTARSRDYRLVRLPVEEARVAVCRHGHERRQLRIVKTQQPEESPNA